MRRDSEALKIRTKDFALRVLRLYRSLPRTDEARILGKQLLRSSTSIGANYRAACRGRSRAEFLAKLGIVLEEADETVFWLELLQEGNVFPAEKLRELVLEANELVSIFVSSVRTAKANAEDRSDCRGERAKSDCRGQIAEVKTSR
ncbi:MAG: four helix bundle protein [Terriglobales bacterium]